VWLRPLPATNGAASPVSQAVHSGQAISQAANCGGWVWATAVSASFFLTLSNIGKLLTGHARWLAGSWLVCGVRSWLQSRSLFFPAGNNTARQAATIYEAATSSTSLSGRLLMVASIF
jgi:hypothetical protein